MRALVDADKYYATMCGKVFVKERYDLITGRHPTPYIRVYKERQLSPHVGNAGYEQIGVSFRGKRYTRLVHRIVAQSFVPNPHNLPEVNHKDGNRLNNRAHNLEWTTRSGNALHASEFLGMRGSNVGTSILTEEDVLQIIKLTELGYNQTELGSMYKVSNHTVHKILAGKNWSWLTGISRKEGEVCVH